MAAKAKQPKPAPPVGCKSYRIARSGEGADALIVDPAPDKRKKKQKRSTRPARPAAGRPVGRPAAADRVDTSLAVGDRFKILGRIYEITELTQHLVFMESCDKLPEREARLNRVSLIAGLENWISGKQKYEFERVKNT